MGRVIVSHVDEAPFVRGEPRKPGEPRAASKQFLGDEKKGPWITVGNIPPDHEIKPHSHTEDEVIHIVDGEILIANQKRGPGTILFIEKDTPYGFTTGPDGVRFLIVRPGNAQIDWKK